MFHRSIQGTDLPADSHMLRRCAAISHARLETTGRGLGAAKIDDRIRHFLEVDILYQTQSEGLPMDIASRRTLSAMHALSSLYQTRMRANIAKGAHPWEGDHLLERDFRTCNRLFEDGKVTPRA
ncbi:hypothetical protein AADZ90_015550 [Aestuariibius sp. 2305UL40-4]|uniref:hypothetical protein n=1 Tax=Aestuariibius violaceus TaxID=3234132 RepID=UPI00345F1047